MRLTIFLLALVCLSSAQGACRNLAPARGVNPPTEDQWGLATLNLWRLRDTRKDSDLDKPLSATLFSRRLDAVADTVLNTLKAPALLVVQEVENRQILDLLAGRLASRGAHYRVLLLEGNDPSGMDVGLLYRSPVKLDSPQALFADERFRGHHLYSRPPLKVTIREPFRADLVVVHLRSARDLASARVFEKRRRQATLLAEWVAAQTIPLIVAGDFNSTWGAGRFSDSYQHFSVTGLFNVWQRLAVSERYSFRHRCRPQALDHIWVSPVLKSRVESVAVTRGNAGRYRALYGSNGVSPISDHDALVVYFSAEK